MEEKKEKRSLSRPGEEELKLYDKIKSIDSKIAAIIKWLLISGTTWILGNFAIWFFIEKDFYLYNGLLGFAPLAIGSLLLINCIEDIIAKPPNVALVVYRKERIPVTKKEGFRVFFKRFPIFYDYFLVNVEKRNQDLPSETVRTPDLGLLKIPISITWTPGAPEIKNIPGKSKTEIDRINSVINGKYLINYINHGEDEGEEGKEDKKGIRNILADIVKERVREWAMSPIEGPQTYIHALGAQQAAVAILLKAIAGEELEPHIPSKYQDIPTAILICYFSKPQIAPTTENQRKRWGSTEKGKEDEWTQIDKRFENKEDEKAKLEKLIDERRTNIKKVQRGNGTQGVFALGITINRLNIGEVEIDPSTELAKMAGQRAAQEERMKAKTLRVDVVKRMIESLVKRELQKGDFTPGEARDIVQTEGIDETRVSKEIKDFQGLKSLGEGIGEVLKRR